MKQDWCGFGDVGKDFEGRTLSLSEYYLIEERYIKAALIFARFHDIDAFILRNVEKLPSASYNLPDKKQLVELQQSIHEGISLPIELAPSVIKLILRELLWANIFAKQVNNFSIRFGYDFYMYFNSDKSLETIIPKIQNIGLFVR
ncbi:MAG: hypothetical protein EOO15_13335 [Chitinophagaceae bacterium]|nr:MAG: hypothetical protein EOO15_13335 [Chitinophagaceae bacterium]